MTKTCNYYVTLRCNDTCEFCSIWNREYQGTSGLPAEDSSKAGNIKENQGNEILLNIKRQGARILNITGGEPLMREDLPDLLKKAKELGFYVQLTTNGILYPEKARLLGGLADRLFVSLDYPFAEMHDRSRGVECFHAVVKGIKLAQELGQRPIIKFTLTRDSVIYLPEMIELAEKINILVYLNPVYDFHGTQGFEDSTIAHLRYYIKHKRVLVNLAVLELLKDNGNKVILPRCKAKESTITILPDGSQVSPCFFNQQGKQGREDICSSCMRWPYMLPSFSKGLDKYFWLNLYSNIINRRKS